MSDIEKIINDAWENRDNVNQDSDQSLKDTINQMIDDLDSGKVSENTKRSSSSSKREPGFRSFSMGGLEAVLQGGKEKHELNRKTLDARSGLLSNPLSHSKSTQSNIQGDK